MTSASRETSTRAGMRLSSSCSRRKGEIAIEVPNSIYFGGAGWGGAFYIGVYKALAERWGPDFASKTSVNISGDSAGVFWAIAVALGFRPDEVDTIFRKQSYRAAIEGQWLGRNTLYLKDVVTELLSRDPLAYEKLEGRFSTATTCFPFIHTRHKKWTSNSDLIDCVLGSLHIPFYCSRIKPVRGANVVDGAYSICGHHLVDGDRTLFIGIDPNAEITRELSFFQMFFPPVGTNYEELVQSGYTAAMAWDGKYKKKVGTRFANVPVLVMLWPIKFLEIGISHIENVLMCVLQPVIRHCNATITSIIAVNGFNSNTLSLSALLGLAILTVFLFLIPSNLTHNPTSCSPSLSLNFENSWTILPVTFIATGLLAFSYSGLCKTLAIAKH